MSCIAPQTSACPCGTPAFPVDICNAPGLPAIAYRAGDYLAFRHRLLQALPGEQELTEWQPGATGDLAVQLVEWWAYLADILTFYNERYANEQYLGTAIQPSSVNHLVQLLGYRPRPALGARGTLAALLTSTARLPVVLPQGMQVQSKPGPGQSPQLFELDQQVQAAMPDIITAEVVPANLKLQGADGSIWLNGKATSVKAGDHLLLINSQALSVLPITDFAWISVSSVTPLQDPLGNNVTALAFSTLAGTLAAGAQVTNYVLLKAAQTSPLWPYSTSSAIISDSGSRHAYQHDARRTGGVDSAETGLIHFPGAIHLAGIARSLTQGALFLLDVPSSTGLSPTPLTVQSYTEIAWYANGDGPTAPANPTANPSVTVLHTEIFVSVLTGNWTNDIASQATIRYGFSPVGTLAPVLTAQDYLYTGGSQLLAAQAGNFAQSPAQVLLEDVNLNAAESITAQAGSDITVGNFSTAPPAAGLASPISVMFNLLPVSRGQTIASETLGSGNPVIISQDFTLKNKPVTYFADPVSVSGNGFSSTVKIWVDGVQWQEARSFYNQPATAQIFVLYEDDAGSTHVSFGDGTNGARPPTGTNNIVASYRYGAGEQAPAVETLTVVQAPQPGLKSLRNPLPPAGGADADPPQKLASLAPQSVLAFNRAVSLDDYAAIAMTGGGVTQAVAQYGLDPLSQRPLVQVWVAGDDGAIQAAQAALNGLAMPNQRFAVMNATPLSVTLSLTFLFDPRYDPTLLQAAIGNALTGSDASLFGTSGMPIGQVVYDSQIEASCLAIPGVTAVHDLSFTTPERVLPIIFRPSRARLWQLTPGATALPCPGHQHNPGNGNYFVLSASNLNLTPGVSS
jgi:hypothetical protein